MPTTTGVFNAFKKKSMGGLSYNLGADTIKICLTKGTGVTWTPAAHVDDTTPIFGDIGADECSGTNYVSGGMTVDHNPVWVQNNTLNRAELTIDISTATTFASVTITAQRYAVLYNASRSNGLIGWIDFGSDVSPVAADLSIDWGVSGGTLPCLLTLT